MTLEELGIEVSKKLTDQGKLIEAGWWSYRWLVVPDYVAPVEILNRRRAFFAGAWHLHSSLLTVLDPGEEPTEADLAKMEMIDKELQQFIKEHRRPHLRAV
jgi:hypothetical protein